MALRVLHFSDVHVRVPVRGRVPLREMVNKRALALFNHVLRRNAWFPQVPEQLEALATFAHEQDVSLVICTGDYTSLGTRAELEEARRLIDPLTRMRDGFVTVPGNHDLYMPDALRDERFEESFGDLLGTDLPEFRADGPWPLVRLIGEDVAVVAVNSARPNPQVFRSSGRISEPQLAAFRRLAADDDIRERFVIVATHYAPRLEDGRPDSAHHGLENADALLEACRGFRRGLLLHGHVHRGYWLRVPETPLCVFGAGSATHRGRESAWLFDIDAAHLAARKVRWDGNRYRAEAGRIQL